MRRLALNAALSAVASALYVAAFLGGLPFANGQAQAVFLAIVTSVVSALLTYLLVAGIGFLKSAGRRPRVALWLCGLLLVVLLLGLLLPARGFFILSTTAACLLGLVALTAALKKALNGDRLA